MINTEKLKTETAQQQLLLPPPPPVKTKKREDFNIDRKCAILKQYDSLRSCSQRNAASILDISQSTLNRLLKDRDKIQLALNNGHLKRKRERNGKDSVVENALLQWFDNARKENAPISRKILLEKAADFAVSLGRKNFKPTDGWLSRWRKRNNIIYKKLRTTKKDTLDNKTAAEKWINDYLPTLLKDFHPNDIYNTNETGLYYRAVPSSHYNDHHLNKKKHQMKPNEQLTILITCNMTGNDKRKLLVIGKSKNHRYFHGIDGSISLPVTYKTNTNALMTNDIFHQFLDEWDHELNLKNRRIVLILNNSRAHPNIFLTNIKLVFFPVNSTSIIQPLDHGIIKTLKVLYRKEMRYFLIRTKIYSNQSNTNNTNNTGCYSEKLIFKKLSLTSAIHMLQKAWVNIKPSIITDCFKKSGIIQHDQINNLSSYDYADPYEIDLNDLDGDLEEWLNLDDNLQTIENDTEDNNIIATLLDAEQQFMKTSNDNDNDTDADAEDNDDNDDDEVDSDNIVNNDDNNEPPKLHEIFTSLRILRKNLELRGGTLDEFQKFYELENISLSKLPIEQNTILSYCK